MVEIELELSTYCNAKCELCDRFTTKTNLLNRYMDTNELTNFINKIKNEDVKFAFIGSLGDPMLHPDIIDITKFVIETGKSLQIQTNGEMYSEGWWYNFGKMFPSLEIHFALDGTNQKTHYQYRKTDQKKVFKNMLAFNKHAKSVWKSIIFEHNFSDIKNIKKMASLAGVDTFIKPSRSFNENLQDSGIKDYDSDWFSCKIKNNSIHISVNGQMKPCCLAWKDAEQINEGIDFNNFKNINDLYNTKYFKIYIARKGQKCKGCILYDL